MPQNYATLFWVMFVAFLPYGQKKTASLRDEYAVSVSLRYAELVPHAVSTNSQTTNPQARCKPATLLYIERR